MNRLGKLLLMFFLSFLLLISCGPAPTLSFRSRYQWQSQGRHNFMHSPDRTVKPPVAKKVPYEMEMFDDVRIDNYYWLRDDSPLRSEALSYLEAENNYTKEVMSGASKLKDQIYQEIRGKIKEDRITAPIQKGSYCYYQRYLKGKKHPQYCRRPLTIYNTCNFDVDSPSATEHVILDVNLKSQGDDDYFIYDFEVSPNNKLIAYTSDIGSDGNYSLSIIDIETGSSVENPITGTNYAIAWAGDDTVLYTTVTNVNGRTCKVWSHKISSDWSNDQCLHDHEDVAVELYISESREYIFVWVLTEKTESLFYLNISREEEGLHIIEIIPRPKPPYSTAVLRSSHRGDHFFLLRPNKKHYYTELVACSIRNITQCTVLLPHRERVTIKDIQLFENHIAVFELKNGLKKITTYKLAPVGEAITLHHGRTVEFVDTIGVVDLQESIYSSRILRFSYNSMRTPYSIYEYDMESGTSVLLKRDEIVGGFIPSNYVTERKWAVSYDGTKIPIVIFYKKDLVEYDGSNPLVISCSGSFGSLIFPSFDVSRIPFVNKGFIFAIAQVRGGDDELGEEWRKDAMLLKKKNTFKDFIAVSEYLIANKYTSKHRLCIEGNSNGGMLVTAVSNMRPDLFGVVVAESPILLDVLTEMLYQFNDHPSWFYELLEQEFGNPRKRKYYFNIKSFSPIDNIKAQRYPSTLVYTSNLDDSSSVIFGSAKYVAKMRETKKDDNFLLLKTDVEGIPDQTNDNTFDWLDITAFKYAFVIGALNMTEDLSF